MHNVRQCPNCGHNRFNTTLADREHPYAVLLSAQKKENGNYNINHAKVLGVTVYICENCNYIMLFHNN